VALVLVLVTPINNDCETNLHEIECDSAPSACTWRLGPHAVYSCELRSNVWVAGYFPALSFSAFLCLIVLEISELTAQDMTRDLKGLLILFFIFMSYIVFFIGLIVTLATDAGSSLGMPIAFTSVTLVISILEIFLLLVISW
jgi:hypothetical protein